jgi:AcrR family transcriptional regulator
MASAADRRERERGEMRERILDAALKLFASESFESITMRKLADAIEYTPGALYSYFKDKDEILYALHQRGFQKLYAVTSKVADIADPIDRLKRIGELYIQFAVDNPEYYDLMFIASKTGKEIAEQKEWPEGLRSYDMLRETVSEAIAQRRLQGTDVEAIAFTYWAAVHGMVSLLIRQRCSMIPPEDVGTVMRNAFEFLMRATVKAR